MSTSPIVSNAGKSPDIAFGPDNPQTQPPEQQQQDLQIPDEFKDLMIDTITAYRTQWAPNRLLRIAQWMKNTLMYAGQQVIGWDPGSNTYFDALAWWRREGSPKQDGGQDYLEKYINNITQMLGDSFIGTMSRGIPPTIVQPENAEILADVTTAKAAQEAISIIERLNDIHGLVRMENSLLYLYGTYFKHTRAVQDGDWAGWDIEDVFGDIQVNKPDRLHCYGCGTETPAQQFPQGQGRACPQCGKPLGPETFFESNSSTDKGVVGQKKVPKAMVKWDVYSPLEVDCDPSPQIKRVDQSPILSLDLDIDIGGLRLIFPAVAEEIEGGAEVNTTPNASYEKLRRAEVNTRTDNYTPESQNFNATYSRNWMQPSSYWKLGRKDFAEFMLKTFPDGCKVSLVGTTIVDIRKASLSKEWSSCKLRDNLGLYPPSIADNVVPFNERLNDTMNVIDDWIVRCAAGMTIYDKSKIDSREIKGKKLDPGTLLGLQTKASGMSMALRDAVVQFEFSLEAHIFTYPAMLIEMCENISGITPQTFGAGTTPGVETAKGQGQQLDTALTKLNIYWENEKAEHAVASQNALECLQGLLKAGAVGEIYEVIEANGSEFRNNYVNWSKMQGRVKVWPDTDEGLPQSPQQIRETITNLLAEAGKGNQIALKIIDVVPNQEMFMSVMAPPGTVIPGSAQRAKTLQDINTCLQEDWIQAPDPNDPTGQRTIQQLPVVPSGWFEDFPVARDTIRLFCQENQDYSKSNPEGWKRLEAYNAMLQQQDMQEASAEAQRALQVKMAGSPPPPKLNPEQQGLLNSVHQDGAQALIDLLNIAKTPPLQQGQSLQAQTAAAGKLLDFAAKTDKLAGDLVSQ